MCGQKSPCSRREEREDIWVCPIPGATYDHVGVAAHLAVPGGAVEPRTLVEAVSTGWFYSRPCHWMRLLSMLITSARNWCRGPGARLRGGWKPWHGTSSSAQHSRGPHPANAISARRAPAPELAAAAPVLASSADADRSRPSVRPRHPLGYRRRLRRDRNRESIWMA